MELPQSFQLLHYSTLENSSIELKGAISNLFTPENIQNSISELISVMNHNTAADDKHINSLIRLFLIQLEKSGELLEEILNNNNPDLLNELKALSLFYLNRSLVQFDIESLITYYQFFQKQKFFTENVLTREGQQAFIKDNNIAPSTMYLLCSLYEFDKESLSCNYYITKGLIDVALTDDDAKNPKVRRPMLFYVISRMLNWWQDILKYLNLETINKLSEDITPIFKRSIEYYNDQSIPSYIFDEIWKYADDIIGLSCVEEIDILNDDLNEEISIKIFPTIENLLRKVANDDPSLQETLDNYSLRFFEKFLEIYFNPEFIDWQSYDKYVDILFKVHSQAQEIFTEFIINFPNNNNLDEKIRGYPLFAHFLEVMNPDNMDVTEKKLVAEIIDYFFQGSAQSDDEEIIRCFYDTSYSMIYSVNIDLITEGFNQVIANTFNHSQLLEYSITFMMHALNMIPISDELAQYVHSKIMEFLDNQLDCVIYFIPFYDSKTIECKHYIRFLDYLSNINLNLFHENHIDDPNMMILYLQDFFLLLFETNPIEGFTQENHNQYHSIYVQKLIELTNIEFYTVFSEITRVVAYAITHLINSIIDLYGNQIDQIYLDILGFFLDLSMSEMYVYSPLYNLFLEIGEKISPFLPQDHPLFAKYAQLATKFMISPLQSIYFKTYINPEAFIEQKHEMFEYLVPFMIDGFSIDSTDYIVNIAKIKFTLVNGYDSSNVEEFIMAVFKAYNFSAGSLEMLETCLLAMALNFRNHQKIVFNIAMSIMNKESLLGNQRVRDIAALLFAALIHRYTPVQQLVEQYQKILEIGISEARHADCELLVAKYSQNMEDTKKIIDNFDISQTVLHCHITKILDELLGNKIYSELRLVLYEIAACYQQVGIDVFSDNTIDFANYVTHQTRLQMRWHLLNCFVNFPDIYNQNELQNILQRKACLRYRIFPIMQQQMQSENPSN